MHNFVAEEELGVLSSSSLRYFLFTGSAFIVFWVLLRSRLGHRRIQRRAPKRKSIVHDLKHSVVGLMAITVATTAVSVLRPLGMMQIYDDPAGLGWGYFALSVGVLVLGHDTYIYWTHRLIHRKALFRRFHAVHHRSSNPNPFSSYSLGWLDGMIHGLYLPLMAVVMPLNLGAIAVFLVLMMTVNVYVHLGYELLPRGFARHPVLGWIATSTFHNLHHQRSHCNYGTYFTWWDRLMGTAHPDYVSIFESVTAQPLLGSSVKTKPRRHDARWPTRS